MLCTLKVRLTSLPGVGPSYGLQITAKHAVGGAGGSLSDEESYPALPDLLHALESLGASEEALSDVADALGQEGVSDRWLTVGTEVQIPFDTLVAEDFYMEERG